MQIINSLSYMALLPAAGFCYQHFGTKRDEKNYPPPGDLIDVGGYQLHFQCQGKAHPGIPTVIVETGIWDSCQSWKLIQSEIAATTRICTYDRAGYGWSEQSHCSRTFEHIVRELKILLDEKGIKPPFIFMGHSLGGAIIRYYQSQYPDEVVGMVFVDAILTTEPPEVFSRTFRVASQAFSFLAHFGLLRLLFKLSPPISANPQWTSTMQSTYTACHQAKVKTFTTCLAEWDGYKVSFTDLKTRARSLKDIPVTIISRDPAKPMRPGMSKEAAKKEREDFEKMYQRHREDLPHARFIVAEKSSHLVQIDRPDVVVDEIRRMIQYLNRKI